MASRWQQLRSRCAARHTPLWPPRTPIPAPWIALEVPFVLNTTTVSHRALQEALAAFKSLQGKVGPNTSQNGLAENREGPALLDCIGKGDVASCKLTAQTEPGPPTYLAAKKTRALGAGINLPESVRSVVYDFGRVRISGKNFDEVVSPRRNLRSKHRIFRG